MTSSRFETGIDSPFLPGARARLAVVAGVLGALWLLGMAALGKKGMRQN